MKTWCISFLCALLAFALSGQEIDPARHSESVSGSAESTSQQDVTTEAARRQLGVVTNSTAGQIVKYSDGSGGLTDSIMSESNGKIGIGTADPKATLHLYSLPPYDIFLGMGYDPSASSAFTMGYSGFSFGRGSGFFNVRPDSLAANPNPSLRFLTQNVQRMLITNIGNVGIGTFGPLPTDPWPANNLHIRIPNGSPNAPVKLETIDADSITALSLKNDARNWHIRVDGSDGDKFKIWDSTANAFRMTIQADGKVGIGTTTPTETLEVNGTIKATKVIGAVYQDFAEWVPASIDMTPGTVVVLSAQKRNEVSPSSTPYDTTVAGVVSAEPGILLGEESASKEMIATTGRVKVRVDATRAPIAIGDLLVTSDVPGTAMKSIPIDLGGAAIHRPGTIIGKALEPLANGTGDILVLLSLQ